MDWPQILWFVSYTVVLLGLSVYGAHRLVMVYLYWKHIKDDPKPAGQFQSLPFITVQLPIFNEQYVVRRLIQSVGKLDYPKRLLEVQILDDSTDDTTKMCEEEAQLLREQGFDIKVIHRTDRTGFKAGALENGTKSAKGEFLFILDADFVPSRDVLQQMVHYFTDPKVAMVQTRWGHINKGYSLLTKVQAMFLDGHLILEQTARSRSGRFFNFNGTAGIWRREAIADSGGWEHDTLTEDMDLSYRAQMRDWKFIYLKDVVTPAELPVDMNGFKSQQHRWAKGSIQTCKKMLAKVWRSHLPLKIKLEATIHLTANFAYLLLAFLCFLVYPSSAKPQLPGAWGLLLDIPIFICGWLSVALFYAVCQRALDPSKWLRRLIYLPVLLALGIGMSVNNGKAVLEALFNKHSPFVRTPKYGIDRKKQGWQGLRYTALQSVAPVFELLFALYFTVLVVYAVMKGYWLSVPFLLMFQLGFLYVGGSSLLQRLPKGWFKAKRKESEEVASAS